MANEKSVMIEPGLHVEFAFGPDGFVSRWKPGIPKPLSKRQLKRYRAARDEYLKDLSIDIEGIMVIDWEGTHMFNGREKLTVSRELGT